MVELGKTWLRSHEFSLDSEHDYTTFSCLRLTNIMHVYYHVHMLNKRTQILLDEETYKKLKILSAEKNTSIGEVVRTAVNRQFTEEDKLKRRKEAIEKIIKWRKKAEHQKWNYKEMINYGRKY